MLAEREADVYLRAAYKQLHMKIGPSNDTPGGPFLEVSR